MKKYVNKVKQYTTTVNTKALLIIVPIVALFAISTIMPSIALAATESNSSNTSNTTEDKIEKTLDARYQQYKKDHPNELSKAQLNRLKNLCKPAQVRTKKMTEMAVKKGDQRLELYQKLATKLDDLVKKLKEYTGENKPNTVELEVKVTELKAKIDSFKVDLSSYQVALNDLSSINCEEFTDTFKAALDEVRAKQKLLLSSSDDVRTLLKDDIKPEIVKIAEALGAKTDSSDNTDTNNDKTEDTTGDQTNG